MPKKDAASVVLGMLSTAGAQTRPAMPAPEPAAPEVLSAPEREVAPAAAAAPTEPAPTATVSPLPAARPTKGEDLAPRTLRLRPDTAAQLRAAWLEAKRDDVLLTAQDFASNLVDDALARHRRRRAVASS